MTERKIDFMKTDLFHIGKFVIHGYGLMIGIGVLCCIFMGMKRAKKNGLSEDAVIDIAIWGLLAGFLGAKLLYVIVEWKRFLADPLSVLGSEGFVVYGGIIAGVLAAIIYCKRKKLVFLEYFDLCSASIALAQGFGRIGCFLAGCCYGRETDSWVGVVFPQGCMAPAGVKLIPTQLFSAAFDIGMFVVLCILINSRKYIKGIPTSVYLIGYAVGRAIIECFRSDERGSVGMLSTSQFISIFICIAGIILLCFILNNNKKRMNND